jgi:hypothetical protein
VIICVDGTLFDQIRKGRPLAIFERDFDTLLPNDDDVSRSDILHDLNPLTSN